MEGAELGACEIEVRPGSVRGGEHRFSVGSAGSAGLVLQTVLPALLASGESARLTLEGGTHNPFAPPYDYLQRVLLPILGRMGASVKLELDRPGFYPAGGGRFRVDVASGAGLAGLSLLERGKTVSRRARALVAHLPGAIAARELRVVREKLGWSEDEVEIVHVEGARGPGNVLLLELESEHVSEVCAGFGERGIKAESVARRAVGELRRYIASDAPVGVHLADQLMVPFAIAGEGAFRTQLLSEHARTNLEVIRKLLPVRIDVREVGEHVIVEFGGA